MDVYKKLEDSLWAATTAFMETHGLDTKVIISHESGQEPKGDYLAIQIISLNPVGSAWKSTNLNSRLGKNISEIHDFYEILIGFRFSGDSVGGSAVLLDTMIKNSEQTRWLYQREGLSALNKMPLRRVPVLKESKWHNAFSLDVTFTYSLITEEEVDWIEKVDVLNLVNNRRTSVELNKL